MYTLQERKIYILSLLVRDKDVIYNSIANFLLIFLLSGLVMCTCIIECIEVSEELRIYTCMRAAWVFVRPHPQVLNVNLFE